MKIVIKVGSSSVTSPDGTMNAAAIEKLSGEVKGLIESGHQTLVVTSGSIATGLKPFGFDRETRPKDADQLRAASAIGQISLMMTYQEKLAELGLVAGQVLLAPTDFWFRNRYLKSRGTILALMDRGAIPVVNENDAVADEEIRFGDNDRLAALVAHLIDADRLVLLTDTPGLFTADPRQDSSASLIEEIVEFDRRFEEMAGGTGSAMGSGGMASKLAAAKIATWSGVETVIAQADRLNVIGDAISPEASVGTTFRPRSGRLPARKLWIAFALPASGQIVVDSGAREALECRMKSLLAAGIRKVTGSFGVDSAVELSDESGEVFAKGLTRWTSSDIGSYAGLRTSDLHSELNHEVIHRDDLVILPVG